MSTQKQFEFRVKANNVFRDASQGWFGNEIPLDDPDVLASYTLWNQLHVASKASLLQYSAIEIGGAHPQVTAVFRGEDPNEAYRKIREAAPNAPQRPLWRGANGVNLAPKSLEELEEVLTQFATDTAGEHTRTEDVAELLRVKIFDSQGVLKEVKSSVAIIAKLREKAYPVTAEVAIPYSNDVSVYPDDVFVSRAVEAAKFAAEHGIPASAFRVSLKDMAGEMDAESAARLVRKVIEGLKAEGLEIEIGLHLHDTGLATDAYVAAIKVCKELNWPISVDTVEGKNTGFASTLELDAALKKEGIDLEISDTQREKLVQMGQLIDKAQERYKLRRVQVSFTGNELRQFKIPGGGLASFEAAVKAMNLADRLGVTQEEAMRVAGNALIAVGRIMGEPFAVTPGFQNKQTAALNLLHNMIEKNYLQAGASEADIVAKVLAILTDEQVKTFFLPGLSDAVQKFLQGDMPIPVHPVVRGALGHRDGLLTDGVESQLSKIKAEVEALQKKGYIRPTETQACAVLHRQPHKDNIIEALKGKKLIYDRPDGTKLATWESDTLAIVQSFVSNETEAGAIVAQLAEAAKSTAVSWAVVLGGSLAARVKRPWLHKPDASHYTTREDYTWALARYAKSRSYAPDAMDDLERQWHEGTLSTEAFKAQSHTLLEQERSALHQWVLKYIEEKGAQFVFDISNGNEQALMRAVHEIYELQQKQANKHLARTGHPFLYPVEQRINLALGHLGDTLEAILDAWGKKSTAVKVKDVVGEVQNHREISLVIAPLNGKVVKVSVKEGDAIVKGQEIAIIEAMKMQNTICVSADGKVKTVSTKGGADVAKDAALVSLDVPVREFSQGKAEVLQSDGILAQGMAQTLTTLRTPPKLQLVQVPEVQNGTHKLTPTPAQKRGYNRGALTQGDKPTQGLENVIHVVGNRGGCAAKILGDLEQIGQDVRVMYVDGDDTTPVIANLPAEQRLRVKSYADQNAVIASLRALADANTGKTILLHPGWGFLSENDAFVKRVEQELEGRVVFVGPASKSMEIAGGKKTLRDLVQDIAPQLNPQYLGNKKHSVAELARLVDMQRYDLEKAKYDKDLAVYQRDLSLYKASIDPNQPDRLEVYGVVQEPTAPVAPTLPNNPLLPAERTVLDTVYYSYFSEIIEGMGADVMIKAVAGGGGRGIRRFTYNSQQGYVENYARYLKAHYETVEEGERLFGNGEVLTEQCIKGKTRHLEVQFAATQGQALCLGLRDCTAQIAGQKFAELNLIEGDYPADMIAKIKKEVARIAEKLAADGYQGLGTLEMLVVPETGEICILEVNPRLQVEHGVTEQDIALKTGKQISLPVLNAHLLTNKDGKSPAQILNDVFGITAEDLAKIDTLAKERITHLRINSTSIGTDGKQPTLVKDDMWPTALSTEIAEGNHVILLQGGLGKGIFDPQIGAILGKQVDVLKAARQLYEGLSAAKLPGREHTANTNLAFTLAIYDLMFNQDGTIRRDFTTRSTDDLLKTAATFVTNPCNWPGQQEVDPACLRQGLYGEEVAKPSFQTKLAQQGASQSAVMAQ